jgi:hypothetical protein
MTRMLCQDGLCRNSKHGRLLQELFPLDPLFPFLFIIVMEALSKMHSTTVDGGLFSGFSMGSRYSVVVNIITHVVCGQYLNFLRGQS